MFAISNTDLNWFDFIKNQGHTNNVNFWTPTPWNVKKIKSGDRLYFMLKSPVRKIGGFGKFDYYENMDINEAWRLFGPNNGFYSKEEFADTIYKYREKRSSLPTGKLDLLGCIVLNEVETWDVSDYKEPQEYNVSFPRNIVTWKTYDQPDPFEAKIYLATLKPFVPINMPFGKSKRISLTTIRSNQGSFRAKLFESYGGKCCVTGETTPELLEAAHIQPYLNDDSNHVQNGLLLRVDLHRLYDAGLIYINENYILEVSSLLAQYYQTFKNKKISLPPKTEDYPNIQVLQLRKNNLRS